MIRQENEIVIVNDKNEERKLSLCKMIKFNEGLSFVDGTEQMHGRAVNGAAVVGTLSPRLTLLLLLNVSSIHRLQEPVLSPSYALLPERGKHATC